jgi:DNA-binding transcriptional MerR regulator
MDELAASTAALREKIIHEGGNVSKFDDGLRADLRQIMKSKGVPNDKIDALLAEHRDNPINAVKAYVAEHKMSLTAKDIDAIDKTTENRMKDSAAPPSPSQVGERHSLFPRTGITTAASDAMADLKALGVVHSDHDATAAPTHGVTTQVAAITDTRTIVS